jgi:hypothetical protein
MYLYKDYVKFLDEIITGINRLKVVLRNNAKVFANTFNRDFVTFYWRYLGSNLNWVGPLLVLLK